jgi:hypothetical protein
MNMLFRHFKDREVFKLFNSASRYEYIWRSEGIAPFILKHGIRWTLSGQFHVPVTYPLEHRPPAPKYESDMRNVGLQSCF